MAVTFNDVQRVAEDLHLLGHEADHRSAVSRNYYAALHASIAWIASVPGVPSIGGASGGTHTIVENQLGRLDPVRASRDQIAKGKRLAMKLRALKARRVIADYKLADQLTQGEIDAQRTQTQSYLQETTSAP